MTKETFELINAVKSEGIEGLWGVVENINTRDYFGSEENLDVEGMYLYVYHKEDDYFCFISKFTPDHTVTNGIEKIDLYKLD